MPLLARVRQQNTELTQASFLDRSAAVSGCPSVASFCFDLGLDLKDLRKGCPEQLTRLAECVGSDPALAVANAIREVGPRSFELRRCHVISNMLRTDEVALCPGCVNDDLINGPARRTPYDNVWLRIAWHFRGIETCNIHNYRLERFLLARTRYDQRSFVVFGWDAAYQLQSGARSPVPQEPTEFENYMTGRLNGAEFGTWLDTIPFSEVVRLCSTFGRLTYERRGHQAEASIAGRESRTIRDAGFQLLKPSRRSIPEFLTTSFSEHRGAVTAIEVHKILGTYLTSILERRGYETTSFSVFREEVAEFIKQNRRTPSPAASKPRTGCKSEGKKPYKICEVAEILSLSPQTVATFASEAQLPFNEHGALTDHAVDLIRAKHKALCSMEQVRDALGIPNGGVWRLAEAGLLGTVHRGNRKQSKRKFDPGSASTLLDALRDAASASSSVADGITLNEAARKYRCGLDTVVKLILSRRLKSISYIPGITGLASLRLCEKEFFQKLTGVNWFGVTIRQACQRLGVSYIALKGLVLLGFLEEIRLGSATAKIVFISESSLIEFDAKYITASAAASLHHQHSSAMIRELERKGIKPDITRGVCGANFYLRWRFGL
ncbi:TniQ family protein [Aureimonas sp. Leaf324]|uniref:TniQ family protein n=1 Tax=Aureimonas sp. Leaf324 TaxID=1736336 RepID=UPI0009EBAA40|nr:TniQ family protein [Aureimonas sp. Leaf324]